MAADGNFHLNMTMPNGAASATARTIVAVEIANGQTFQASESIPVVGTIR